MHFGLLHLITAQDQYKTQEQHLVMVQADESAISFDLGLTFDELEVQTNQASTIHIPDEILAETKSNICVKILNHIYYFLNNGSSSSKLENM